MARGSSQEEKTTNSGTPVLETNESTAATTQKPVQPTEHPLSEIVRFAIIALIIVIPIRLFIAQPFIVSGASMEDTFQSGEYLIVDQVSYHFEEPTRGEVIIFRYPRDPDKFFIKRVIGVPGDTIAITGSTVTITNDEHPDGLVLDEPYVDDMSNSGVTNETLGPGEYFVMGDNRDQSSDSRTWGILTEERIVGRAFVRLFPFNKVAVFPGETTDQPDVSSSE